MPIVETGSWQGFLASKGTPPAMVAKLNAEIRKILAMPDISGKITELGGDVRTGSPEEFAAWMTKAIAEWGEVVKAEEHPDRRMTRGSCTPSPERDRRLRRRERAQRYDLTIECSRSRLRGLSGRARRAWRSRCPAN